ncbi:MAG TPA: rhomboid family protein [Verrucomicrobiae bacterium]|nr:rhomboid family protein [Verrucomicrobiae bacterium]
MSHLTLQRCFHHAGREAVARCPQCRSYFCRECITEHEDRVICASCLKKLARVPFTRRAGFVGVLRVFQVMGGLLIAAGFFYWVGQTLLDLPSSFHDGTLWRGRWIDEEP